MSTQNNSAISYAFENQLLSLELSQLVPIKDIKPLLETNKKCRQTYHSVQEIGAVEPIAVSPLSGARNKKYTVVDGHIRLAALQAKGIDTALCLIARDDESYTYNKFVNHISPVQEHNMIKKAIDRGVSEEALAKALNMDINQIIHKQNLLKGICREAIELLKDKMVPTGTFRVLKRMKPYRQYEVATLMNDTQIYTIAYAQTLFNATPAKQLINPKQRKNKTKLDTQRIARLEKEMATIQREYQIIEDNYSNDVLNLTVAKSYLTTLLENTNVNRYLAKYQPEILTEFQKIINMNSLASEVAIE